MQKNTAQVSINGRKTNALCDTGASISCANKAFITKVLQTEANISPSHIKTVVGVGGEQHSVSGKIDLDICFSGVTVSYSFHVIENLHHSLILGLDFMEAFKVKIDVGNKTMSILDAQVCMLSTNAGYARISNPVTIPPLSEADINIKISRCTNEEVLVEPVAWLQKLNVQGAKCVVTVRKGKAIMRILNPSDKAVHLPGNKVIGIVTPLVQASVFTLSPHIPHDTPTADSSTASNSNEISDEELSFDFSNSDLTEEQKNILMTFLKQNKDIFTTGLHNLGRTELQKHDIDTGNAPPVKSAFYKQSPNLRRETERQVKEMLKHNIIEPSSSAWHSPVVLIKKSNGEYRFAVDYRKLNKVTKPQSFPLPRLSDMFDAIGESNAKFFTSADISKAFWQVPLTERAKEKSAFITYDGIYAWNCMPFGLMGAPATFQSLLSNCMRNINWRYVLCYIDDIVIFSQTFELHLQHISEVFQRLREAGLRLSPSKCFFAQRQIRYLGHILSKEGVLPDSSKFDRVRNLPVPRNETDVKSVLGLFNFYKKFVQGYSKICAPLFGLLQKDKPFLWNESCQNAFDTLKNALINAPVLAYPDMNRGFSLSCDASRSGLGYILGQVGEDNLEHVIAYGGRALRKPEKNYTVTELECLAIVEGIKEYRTYLSSGKFTVYTDHKALKYLQSLKTSNPQGRLARWSMELQEFDFDVEFRKGVNNQNADALSRLPFQNTEEQTGTNTQSNYEIGTPSLKTHQSIQNANLMPNPVSSITDSLPAEIPVCLTETANSNSDISAISSYPDSSQVCSAKTVKTNITKNPKQCVNEQVVSASEGPVTKQEWLKVSFDFGPPLIGAIDQNYEVNIPNDEVEENEEQQLPLIEKQKLCPDFEHIIKYLETNELPDDPNLSKSVRAESEYYDINEGILIHFHQSRYKKLPQEARDIAQTCLPTDLRLKAMQAYHDDNGHFGVKKTFSQMSMKYYWPRMYKDIFHFVKSCDRCQRAKRDNAAVPPPLHPLPVVSVFGRLHMDIIGPLHKSSEGHQYILVVVDSQSRWVEAWPLKSQTATEIARLLHDEIFCRYGPAVEIISDRGRNFLSKLVQAVCELYHVTRHSTSSYRPSCNGCVERQNANIIQTIRMYVDRSQRDWHMILPVALMALRSSPNLETSGFSPFKMLFGCEMRLPFDINLIPRDNLGPEAKIHMEHLLGRLKLYREIAKDNSEAAKEKDKIKHDIKAKDSTFLEGEQVLVKINKIPTELSPKLYDKFDGPYYIRRKCPNDTYIIADSATDRVQPVRHNATRLRRYYDPQDYRFEPATLEQIPEEDPVENPAQIPEQNPDQTAPRERQPPPHPNDPPQEGNNEDTLIQNQDPEPNNTLGGNIPPRAQQPQNINKNPPTRAPRHERETPNPANQDSNNEKEYFTVEKVLKMRLRGGKREFLLKWVGNYPSTWEPETNLSKHLKREYFITHTKQGRKRKKKYRYFH